MHILLPWKWTNVSWKGTILKWSFIFQPFIFGGYVSFQGVYLTSSNTVDGSEILRAPVEGGSFPIICKVLYIFQVQVVVWDSWTMNSSDKWGWSSGSPTKNAKALVMTITVTEKGNNSILIASKVLKKNNLKNWRRWVVKELTFFCDAVRQFCTTSGMFFLQKQTINFFRNGHFHLSKLEIPSAVSVHGAPRRLPQECVSMHSRHQCKQRLAPSILDSASILYFHRTLHGNPLWGRLLEVCDTVKWYVE